MKFDFEHWNFLSTWAFWKVTNNNNLFNIFPETILQHKSNDFNDFKGFSVFRFHPLGFQNQPLEIYLFGLQGVEICCNSGHCRMNKFLALSVYSHGAKHICVIVTIFGFEFLLIHNLSYPNNFTNALKH